MNIKMGVAWRITYQDNLEEHLLIHLHELLIPVLDVGSLLTVVGILVVSRRGVVAVVLAPLDHLPQNGLVDLRIISITCSSCADEAVSRAAAYVGNGDSLGESALAKILQHVLDQKRSLGHLLVYI